MENEKATKVRKKEVDNSEYRLSMAEKGINICPSTFLLLLTAPLILAIVPSIALSLF